MDSTNLPADLNLLLEEFKSYCSKRGFSNIKNIEIISTGLDNQKGVVTTRYTIFLINNRCQLKYISGTPFSNYDNVLKSINMEN